MDVDVPERAQIARVILCEIQRIQSHLVAVGSQAMDIGAVTVMTYAFREREAALDIFEMVSGARMMAVVLPLWRARARFARWFFRRGARVHQDDSAASERVRRPAQQKSDLARAHARHRRVHRRASHRAQRHGTAAARDWRELGLAQSVAVLVATSSTISMCPSARAAKRMCSSVTTFEWKKCGKSLRIIEQALQKLEKTKGQPYVTNNRKVAPPPKQELQNSMESLIHHFKLWTEGITPPVGYAYAPVESPRGELGFLVSSNGTNMPHRVHVRAPSFANLQTLPMISKDTTSRTWSALSR